MPAVKSLSTEDLNYLRAKGVFNLPSTSTRDALITCYFHHVHPFAPILDVDEFIAEYEKGRASLLLLWSMFLAAASVSLNLRNRTIYWDRLSQRQFIDFGYFTNDFFPSRESLKEATYQRAKVSFQCESQAMALNKSLQALYDVDYEKGKVVLIQSVFLLGHWFTSTEDRTGPWYWNGIAITLSQTIGLHSIPDATRQDSPINKPLWRHIWWSIYCREVWLSQAQGRPMRTCLDDVETSMPTTGDIINQLPSGTIRTSPFSIVREYIPNELEELLHGWLTFVRLSVALGKVLQMNYRAKGTKPTLANLEQMESEIRECYSNELENRPSTSKVVISHAHQLRLYFE